MRRFIQAQVEEGYNREIKHDAGHLMTWLDCFLGFLVRTLVTYLSYLVFACICRWSHLPKLGTSQLSAWFIKQKAPPMQRFFQRWAVILSAIFQMSLVPSTEWKSLTGTTAMLARSFRCFFSFPASAGNWLQVPNERRVFSLILFPSQYECRNLAAQRRHLSITKGSCDSMRRW